MKQCPVFLNSETVNQCSETVSSVQSPASRVQRPEFAFNTCVQGSEILVCQIFYDFLIQKSSSFVVNAYLKFLNDYYTFLNNLINQLLIAKSKVGDRGNTARKQEKHREKHAEIPGETVRNS